MIRTRAPYSPVQREEVSRHTNRVVSSMQQRFLAERPEARAQLARLRNALNTPLSAHPEVFTAVFTGLPEHLEGRGEKPNEAELAIHTAVCLYAIHQQSIPDRGMHDTGEKAPHPKSLGHGVARLGNLAAGDDQDKPIARRFNAIITADSFTEIRHHLRGIVQLLRGERFPISYKLLAGDLYQLQYPRQRDAVRLRWSRDALRTRTGTDEANENAAADTPSETTAEAS